MTSDNFSIGGQWPFHGCYAGLGGFASEPGGLTGGMVGRGLIDAAAFYNDDPQYRWLMINWGGCSWTVPTNPLSIHWGRERKAIKPTMYDGVAPCPTTSGSTGFSRTGRRSSGELRLRLAPEPIERALDRVAFRDGVDPQDAYLFLAASQDSNRATRAEQFDRAVHGPHADLAIYQHGAEYGLGAKRRIHLQRQELACRRAACLQEALANLGDVSRWRPPAKWAWPAPTGRGRSCIGEAITSPCWTGSSPARTTTSRWSAAGEAWQPASLAHGDYRRRPQRRRDADPERRRRFQTAEHWPCDGSARPYVLK